MDVNATIIGFCGKIYPVLHLRTHHNASTNHAMCFSVEDVDQFVQKSFDEDVFKAFKAKKSDWRRTMRIGYNHRDFLKFFEECKQQQESHEQIFVENGCPVFVATYETDVRDLSEIVYHGRKEDPGRDDDGKVIKASSYGYRRFNRGNMLKEYAFYKFFDTYTAFQEIHMYLGGVLGFGNPHVPVPDDKTTRDIKGFDNWSFKKPPGGKKRRKNKNKKK